MRPWRPVASRWDAPICFVPSYLSLPSEGDSPGPSMLPWPPSLAAAFKVGRCDAHGLDVCLVPSMQSYHYPCLLTIAGRLCYICSSRPWAMTRLCGWSLLFYISLPVSLCVSARRLCAVFRCDDLLSLLPLKPLWHLARFHAFSRQIVLQRSKKKVHPCPTCSAALEVSGNINVGHWFSLFQGLLTTQARSLYTTTVVFMAS